MFWGTGNLESLSLGMLKSEELGRKSWKYLQVCFLINSSAVWILILSAGHGLGWGMKMQKTSTVSK